MNILLTNHQLADFAGSEMYTFELAKGLKNAGHSVTVYSRYIDKFQSLFETENIQLVSDLDTIQNQHFDIAHVHHNINALEVRKHFPTLPMFFMAHGSKAFLEFPPQVDINVTQYAAVSERVKEVNLRQHGVSAKSILTLNGIIDETRFFPTTPIAPQLKRALVISNHLDNKSIKPIQLACQELGIELVCVGRFFKPVTNFELPVYINQADLVFTLGRGAMEAMMCGRVPFILDYKGGDGIVTSANFKKLEKFHFNGNVSNRKFTTKQISKELKKYDAADAEKLRIMALQKYGVAKNVARLVKIYQNTIKKYTSRKIDTNMVDYLVETVQVTRLHTFSRSEIKLGLREQLHMLRSSLLRPMHKS